MNMLEIIKKLKLDTNNNKEIIYRKKIIHNNIIYIIYNEALTDNDKISDFIIRSLNIISYKYNTNIYNHVINNINNFKVKEIFTYKEISNFLNNGFTIILFKNKYLALETKKNLSRGISEPKTDIALRGSLDSFVEDIQTNIGLIRKRIKDNNLWVYDTCIGKYTNTKINLLYINKLCSNTLVNQIKDNLIKYKNKYINSPENLKNLLSTDNKSPFPTILTTERPDRVCKALLNGKVALIIDGYPYSLILPATFNDFFMNSDDCYSKSINISLIRMIRYLSFFISLITPALYIAITTCNQEILPTELLISFSSQRQSVPFPAYVEAIIMIISFEILRESDLRSPSFSSSALSIVGALILGEAAVNAGIVSPIMIIVISITAISGLPFNEPDMINGLKWYRIIFITSAILFGVVGVVFAFLFFIVNLASLNSFNTPYLYPFSPFNKNKILNTIIKIPIINILKRKEKL